MKTITYNKTYWMNLTEEDRKVRLQNDEQAKRVNCAISALDRVLQDPSLSEDIRLKWELIKEVFQIEEQEELGLDLLDDSSGA